VEERRIQLLRDGYAAVNRGDLEGAFENLAPDFEAPTSGAFFDEGVVYRGPEGARRFLAMVADAFESFEYEVEDVEAAGDDKVLFFLRVRGRGKGSGVDVDMKLAHLWELRGDLAVRLTPFQDRDEARAAAGLT